MISLMLYLYLENSCVDCHGCMLQFLACRLPLVALAKLDEHALSSCNCILNEHVYHSCISTV